MEERQHLNLATDFEGLAPGEKTEAQLRLNAARAEAAVKKMKRRRKLTLCFTLIPAVTIIAAVLLTKLLFIPLYHYTDGKKALDAGEYYAAAEAFARAGDFKDAPVLRINCIYYGADEQMAQGDMYGALDNFAAVQQYGDAQQNVFDMEYTVMKEAQAGDTVYFGSYEQDNDYVNGTEPLSWRVLERDGTRLLLHSTVGIDCLPYHDTPFVNVTWETCFLRKWMYEVLYKSSFNVFEKRTILPTVLVNTDNKVYGTPGGNDTEDYLFLLSAEETERYYPELEQRLIPSTYYSKQRGSNYRESCWWWLRDPGMDKRHAIMIHHDGSIYEYGYNVVMFSSGTVVPAMWIDLDPDNWSTEGRLLSFPISTDLVPAETPIPIAD